MNALGIGRARKTLKTSCAAMTVFPAKNACDCGAFVKYFK